MIPKEIVEGAELSRLFAVKEWRAVANIAERLMNKWTSNQNVISSKSIEEIALERVRWASMKAGVEQLFYEINESIEAYKKFEEKDEPEEKKKPVKRDINPYRRKD